MPTKRTIDGYHFGFSLNLTDSHLRTLVSLFQHLEPTVPPLLDGRASVIPTQLKGIGPVVIKQYRRGGLVRYFIKQRYLKLYRTRAQHEYELLDRVGAFGINVPQPIAYAYLGRLFYRAWLVTGQISQSMTLARLSLNDEKKAGIAMASVIEQISSLIRNDILHVDLHPGNVVIDAEEKVYLLDFDKGSVYHGNRQKLRNRYLTRWQRAVAKHQLPDILSQNLRTGLENLQV